MKYPSNPNPPGPAPGLENSVKVEKIKSTPVTKLETLIKRIKEVPAMGDYGQLRLWVSTSGLSGEIESEQYRTCSYKVGPRLDNSEGRLTPAKVKKELMDAIPSILEEIQDIAARGGRDNEMIEVWAALTAPRQARYEARQRKAGMKTVSVRLDADAAEKLESIATAHGGDKSAAIRELLRN